RLPDPVPRPLPVVDGARREPAWRRPARRAGSPAGETHVSGSGAPAVTALLEIEDLRTHFFTRDGVVRAVDGVSLSVGEGETVAIVGESGCGKSVTSLSILRLIADRPGKITSGRLVFNGKDLLKSSEREMRSLRA